MALFLVRVELRAASEEDVRRLHASMIERGFSNKIDNANSEWFELPDGEYHFDGDAEVDDLLERAKSARDATGREGAVLIAEASMIGWNGLTRAVAGADSPPHD